MSCVHEDRESLYHPLLTWCLNRLAPSDRRQTSAQASTCC